MEHRFNNLIKRTWERLTPRAPLVRFNFLMPRRRRSTGAESSIEPTAGSSAERLAYLEHEGRPSPRKRARTTADKAINTSESLSKHRESARDETEQVSQPIVAEANQQLEREAASFGKETERVSRPTITEANEEVDQKTGEGTKGTEEGTTQQVTVEEHTNDDEVLQPPHDETAYFIDGPTKFTTIQAEQSNQVVLMPNDHTFNLFHKVLYQETIVTELQEKMSELQATIQETEEEKVECAQAIEQRKEGDQMWILENARDWIQGRLNQALAERDDTAQKLDAQNAELQLAQKELNEILRKALVDSNLLSQPESQAEVQIETNEQQSAVQPTEQQSVADQPTENQIADEQQQTAAEDSSQVITEQQQRQEAEDAIEEARQALYNARAEFENQSEHVRWETDDYYARKDEVGVSQTSTDFFRMQFVKKGNTTAHLVWAEENLRFVKQQAFEANVLTAYNSWGQESDFIEYPDDGYRESLEAAMVTHCPTKKIEAWLEEVSPEDGIKDEEDEKKHIETLENIYDQSRNTSPSRERKLSEAFESKQRDVEEVEPYECDFDLRSVSFAESLDCRTHGQMRRFIDRYKEIIPGRER